MVRFKRDLDRPCDGEPDDTYWAIGGSAVQTASMWPRPTSGDDAVANQDRKQRGLVNYSQCLVKELRECLRARNIDIPKDCVRKEALITLLEKADDEVKFTKFFELPAELRNMVFEKYFENLGDLPLLPHQPPLLLASSRLREEASPVYYSHSTFTLGFVTNLRTPDLLSHYYSPSINLRTSPHKDTDALLKHISSQDFFTIHHLKIQLWKPELDVGSNIVSFATWTVDLTGSTKPAITHKHQDYTSHIWRPTFEAVGDALEPVLEEIREQPGPHKITKMIVYLLMNRIHMAMMTM